MEASIAPKLYMLAAEVSCLSHATLRSTHIDSSPLEPLRARVGSPDNTTHSFHQQYMNPKPGDSVFFEATCSAISLSLYRYTTFPFSLLLRTRRHADHQLTPPALEFWHLLRANLIDGKF